MLLDDILNLPANVKSKILEEFFSDYTELMYYNINKNIFIHRELLKQAECNIKLKEFKRYISQNNDITIDIHSLIFDIIKEQKARKNFTDFLIKTFELKLVNKLNFRELWEDDKDFILSCLYDDEKTNNDLLCTDTITYLEFL